MKITQLAVGSPIAQVHVAEQRPRVGPRFQAGLSGPRLSTQLSSLPFQ